MPRIKEVMVYKFSELSEEEKEKVLNHYRYLNVDDSFWYESTLDYYQDDPNGKGITFKTLYFKLNPVGCEGVRGFDYDKEKILENLRDKVKDYSRFKTFMDRWEIGIMESRHSFHVCLDDRGNTFYPANKGKKEAEFEAIITEYIEDYFHSLVVNLDKEYQYLTSDETIKATIEDNEWEFDENGNLA